MIDSQFQRVYMSRHERSYLDMHGLWIRRETKFGLLAAAAAHSVNDRV